MGSGNETNGYLRHGIRRQEGRNYPPVYRQAWSYAVEHGELEEYRASRKLDEECKVTVEKTFRQNYDGRHLNLDIVRPLAEQYGLERMTFILANTIRQASWDGRFSRDNRSWASGVSIDEDMVNGADRNRYLSIGVHLALLDGFISMFRREIPELEKENGRDFRSMQAAGASSVPGYVVMSQFDRTGQIPDESVYLGISENYRQDTGIYDNSDNSLVFVSDNPKMFSFLDTGKGWISSQQEMIDNGAFTAADYAEYDRIIQEILSAYPDAQIKHFSIDIDRDGSGIQLSPDWQPEKQRSIMLDALKTESELAFRIADRYISIQETEGGYDYSIMDANYRLVDGGVYGNSDVTIREALDDIVGDLKYSLDNDRIKGNIKEGDELMPLDYDELMEKAEEAGRIKPAHIQSRAVEDFRTKTNEQFHRISEMSPAEIEETAKCYVQGKLEEYGIAAEIVDAVVEGSRCRGLERKGADLDVVVELSTQEREDALFDMLNEDGLYIGGVKVDINPITAQKTGTLETYLLQAEAYLEEVRKAKEYAVPQEKLKEFVKDHYGHYGDAVCTKKIAEALSVSIRRMIDTHQMENTRGAIEAVLDKDSTHEFVKSRQPNISPVPAEVIQAVDEYFGKALGLGNFTPVKICRISNDPGDHYLYAAVGYNLKTEEYACWTSWNHSIASLNMGHYNLPDEQAALDIIRDRFNDISDEPGKYGMEHTLMSIKQPEIDNLQQTDQKQEQAGKIVHFSGRRGR